MTTINYQLPTNAQTKLRIFNINGQEVRTLVSEQQRAGSYSITWNGMSERGLPVASGIYFYKLEAGSFLEARKMILIQ